MHRKDTTPPPCKHCGSQVTIWAGFSQTHRFPMYQCKDCGRRSTDSPNKAGGNNKLDDGLTLAERRNKWKRENRAQCTERDRKTRQLRKQARKEAKEKTEG